MILAIPAAVPAIPANPRIAAIIAITRNTTAQFNIYFKMASFFILWYSVIMLTN